MNRENQKGKKSNRLKIFFSIIVPVSCAVLFMVLCMVGLKNSIWFDESYSAYLIRGNFGDIWSLTASDVHPPFYYFCLKIWSLIFGYSDVALRFMSVFFGALTIIILFYLLRRWFGLKIASVATFFLTLSPMFVRYGQEMRMYMLVFFIVALATYVLDIALETKKTRYYILYAILISLGMWTHYFTAIAWLAHIIYYMAARRAKIWDKKFLLTYALAVLLYIPWIPSFLAQTNSVQSGFWIPELSFGTVASYISEALIFKDASAAKNWLVVLLLATILAVIFAGAKVYRLFKAKEKQSFLLLASLVFIPPIILMLLSVPPFKPIFVSRYVTYAAALLWALIGTIVAKFVCQNHQKNLAEHSKQKSIHATVLVRLALSAALVLLTISTAILGVINVETRETESYVKQAVLAIDAISESGTPIIPADEWVYYDAVFYSNDKTPVYGLDALVNTPYDSFLPIERYNYNMVENDAEFLKGQDKIWYLVKTSEVPENTTDYEFPDVLKDYHIVSDFSDKYLTAFELSK